MKRPSLGITPRKIHEASRLDEIRSAISRRYNNEEIIPTDWIEEYNELIIRYNKEEIISTYWIEEYNELIIKNV